ncbi:hypothetical protein KOW79_007622 [Hemibagrus wyckioides]|uniref:Uncharacterized protein n=1 Tax=Hemibagrus wyckioides TaxID=337641 RepID=A0A9D3SS39_9TELE|nr:hypothetical protein KOW79_007622 [Hemibagrus wyckioides]
MSEWLPAEEGAAIGRDLVLYGSGLGHMGPGMARPLWQPVSVAKCILWGARCEGIRSLSRRVSQAHLFRLFRVKRHKVQGEEQGGEGFVRVGVGVLEGGGFSGTMVLGAPWWPDRGEETIDHALWSCPIAARFWRHMSEWLPAEEGAAISRDLVLYGTGLGHMGPGMARPLWQAVSVVKCVLWGTRCEGIRSLYPHVNQARLFQLFSAKLHKV